MSAAPELVTDRLLLTPVQWADEHELWQLHSDPAAFRFDPDGPLTEPAHLRWVLQRWLTSWRLHDRGNWTVRSLDTADLLGVVGLAPLDADDPVAPGELSLYYRFTPAVHGRGYAMEALSALLDDPEHGPGVRDVLVVTSGQNEPSLRLARRLGFEPAQPQRPVPADRPGDVLLIRPGRRRHTPESHGYIERSSRDDR